MTDILLFSADGGGSRFRDGPGTEPWVTDPLGGPPSVIDLIPGIEDSNPANGVSFRDGALFTARGTAYFTDGTVEGTTQVQAIDFGPGTSAVETLSVVGDALYIRGYATATGFELYRFDDLDMPRLVRDIAPGPASSLPGPVVDVDGIAMFTATDGIAGTELWRSDGTENGTYMVADIAPGSLGSNPVITEGGVLDGRLYFSADDGTNTGREVWVTDEGGTGASLLADINQGPTAFGGPTPSQPSDFTAVGDTMYFTAINFGRELWKSDGTPEGTTLVSDLRPGTTDGVTQLTALGNLLVFAANGGQGQELWRSDGTEDGTALIRDINPAVTPVNVFGQGGPASSSPTNLFAFQGRVYFSASDGTNGRELWVTDGTTGGTSLLRDIRPGEGSSFPGNFVAVDDLLYFSAFGPQFTQLWITDGTATGTLDQVTVNPDGSDPVPLAVIDPDWIPAPVTPVDPNLPTLGDDRIRGTDAADNIDGRAGDDRIDGLLGDDTLRGGSGNDTLVGGPGDDRLEGGEGDDVYVVTRGDEVLEPASSEGFDEIRTGSDFTIAEGVERITATGNGNVRLDGSGRDEALIGNRGDNILVGFGGEDTMTGGGGRDVFVLTALGGTNPNVTITDWGTGGDQLAIDDQLLGIGARGIEVRDLTASVFRDLRDSGSVGYNGRTGELRLDIDGDGNRELVATIEGGAQLGLDDVLLF